MVKGKHIAVTFQCREILDKIFDDMSEDYGMTKDYLINVALLEFAHSKGYIELPLKRTPKYKLEDELAVKNDKKDNIIENHAVPKPPIPPKPPVPPVNSSTHQLLLESNGETYPIAANKQFIIGRGSSADFRIINNPSVSRKHAMVFQKNGKYYIKDMGSTNGVEFEGKKYDIRQISDGETYTICDVPFTFKFI